MHQSLYRKYRPTNFDEVVGQKVIVQTLKNAIKNNTFSHAYLFTGPRGTGKTSIAKILAKTINCENINIYNPCEVCVNCTQYNKKQAMDIIEIDAASNNGVDEIRELKSKINLVPSIGKYKIYIIDEVHMLSIGAFNALLKTLEEPPEHIIFILATTDPQKIPATILSRCQRFDFKKINLKEIQQRLNFIIEKENIKIQDSAVLEIARLSDGGMRDALSILDQAISYTNDIITIEDIHEINGTISSLEMKSLLSNIVNKKTKEIFEKIDKYNNDGKDFYKLTEEIILYLRNSLIEKTAPGYLDEEKNYNIDINLDNLINFVEQFNQSLINMKNNSNQKLIFELTIIKLLNIENNFNKTNDIVEKKENKINNENIDNIKNIRINNTLCKFDKKEFLKFKDEIKNLKKYLINKEYTEIVSLLFDGEIKAYGLDNFIILLDSNSAKKFNQQYYISDQIFNEEYGKKIRGIAVDNKEWEIIKNEFNNKQKEYKYIKEME